MEGAQLRRRSASGRHPCGPPKRSGGQTDIQLATAALIAAFSTATPGHHHHHPGCWTPRCDRAANAAWNRHEEEARRRREARQARSFPRIALCVANRESGQPGSYSYSTIRWSYDDGTYEGSMNWTNSTWISQTHGVYGPRADEATPTQQVRVFMDNRNAHDWPETYPACGGG